jgi:hypothetical protein
MVKVLFDHNMPPAIPRALEQLVSLDGHSAVALRDKFPANISDIDYFTQLGSEPNWVVISKDLQNAKRAPERAAIMRSGVLAIYLSRSVQKKHPTEQAATILWQWQKIVTLRETANNGLFQLPEGKGSRFRNL